MNNNSTAAHKTLARIREKYWILKGKRTVSEYVRKCVKCFRFKSEAAQQLMGQLPSSRVKLIHPFLSTGVDCAGPFLVKSKHVKPTRGRPDISYKAYVSLFVCMATKAIHLEVVSDLSTPAFLAAFRRFMSRRRKPTDMFSDNGTNFEGADNELKELKKLTTSTQHNSQLADTLSSEGINWHMNPPGAPHHGGLWEAGVKSMKHHFRRIVGNTVLIYDEFTTVVAQVEAVLNSRPLSALTENPDEFEFLTPGHFLIGRALTTIPEPSLDHLKLNQMSRWQLLQRMQQHFWKKWTADYISALQQRPKWRTVQPNVTKDDLVLLIEPNLPPLQWKVSRIVSVLPDAAGLVRVVDVKTPDQRIHRRPISKIIPLPFISDKEAD